MDQMNNVQMVVMGWREQFQGTHGETKYDELCPKHIRVVLGRYKDVLTNWLP